MYINDYYTGSQKEWSGGFGVFGVLKYYQNLSCGALVPLGEGLDPC